MKKYRNYIIITTLLVLVALFYLINERKGTLKLETNHFALTDTSEISKITIVSNNKTLILQQSGNNWLVNNRYNAKVRMIKRMLGLLSSLEINSPVPKRLRKNVLDGFKKHTVRVKVETNLKIIKEFELFEMFSPEKASVIREPGSNDFYFAKITGFDNPVSILFLTFESIWRDNVVFRYKPWEISSIKTVYPSSPESSFTLDLSRPDLIAIYKNKSTNPTVLKANNIVRYLMNYNSVPYYPVVKISKILRDSLQKVKPICEITVENIEKQVNSVKFYTIPDGQKPGKIDMFKMYAVLQNDTVPVSVKYVDLDPIMKSHKELVNQ